MNSLSWISPRSFIRGWPLLILLLGTAGSSEGEVLDEVRVVDVQDPPVNQVERTLAEELQAGPNLLGAAAPGPSFSVRGVRQDGLATLGTRSNPAVGVTSGGRPVSANELWLFGAETWDSGFVLERGPVIAGRGATFQGGEIRLEPNGPVFANEGRAGWEVGQFGLMRAGLTENMEILEDRLALRLNVLREESDGSIRNVGAVNGSDRRQADLYRAQLRWQPDGTEKSIFDLSYEAERMRGNPLGLARSNGRWDLYDRKTGLNTEEHAEAERHALALQGKVEVGVDSWVEGEVHYQTLNGEQLGDLDGGPLLGWYFTGTADEERWSGGLRWIRKGKDHSILAGVYAEASDYEARYQGVGLVPFPAGRPFDSRVREQVEMVALFVQGDYGISNGVFLTGGLRLDGQMRKQSSRAILASFPVGDGEESVRSVEWLPEAGIIWRGDRTEAGIKLSRSYRPGGAAYAVSSGASQRYGEERGWEWNAFAEQRWDSVKVSGRVFHAEIEGQQVSYMAPGGYPGIDLLVANSGRSRRAGVEMEAEWRGFEHFLVAVAGGYLFTEYDRLVLDGVNRDGQRFGYAPELSGSLRMGWSPPEGWFGESLLAWVDSTYSQPQSPVATGLEARLLLSAKLGYRFRNTEMYVFGTNLLNEDYALMRQELQALGRGIEGKPGLPRCVGVGFDLKW